MNRDTIRELAVFALLLAIGVLGRWAQPTWNFTPIMAVTALGGYYFRQNLAAFLLPVGILAISDILLPTHDNWPVLISVHMMMIVPLLLGRLAYKTDGLKSAMCWAMCGVLPATAFFLVTNFAVWAFRSTYEHSLAGLATCYAAGVPFYRAMLAGDVFYLALLLGCLVLARATSPRLARVRA
jgi:hypothetical protein